MSYRVNLMFRLQKMYQRQWLGNGSVKNEAAIVDREGKSDIWKLFGQLNVKRKWLVTLYANILKTGRDWALAWIDH